MIDFSILRRQKKGMLLVSETYWQRQNKLSVLVLSGYEVGPLGAGMAPIFCCLFVPAVITGIRLSIYKCSSYTS